ncbi:MAG: alpha/beta fold hydrolase [Bacteroidetes bacterium]|nr:alpha/beta fold hydrolase [Bacteroidota bacterium]
MWDPQVQALMDNYRVITYDIRGHGNSDSGNEDFSIELFVKDLIGLINALEIDKTFLCGLSMGGYIALNAIENYPHYFNALILSDTQCIADTPEVKEKRMKTIEKIKENGVEKYADESIKNLFATESFTTKVKETITVKEMIVNTSEKSLCNTLLALSLRNETCSNLNQIKVPILIMVGKEDKITPPDASWLMHEKTHNSLLIPIEQAGHLANLENPIIFNDSLISFVQQINANQKCI